MTEDSPKPGEDRREFSEERESLVRITTAPLIWAAHFVVCYGAVSVACNKAVLTIGTARIGLILFTLIALAGIVWVGWRAFRQWDVRHTGAFSNPDGKAEDRHQFLGHAAFLLAIISAIGVIYVALPLVVLESFR